jgi:hypothetical protein
MAKWFWFSSMLASAWYPSKSSFLIDSEYRIVCAEATMTTEDEALTQSLKAPPQTCYYSARLGEYCTLSRGTCLFIAIACFVFIPVQKFVFWEELLRKHSGTRLFCILHRGIVWDKWSTFKYRTLRRSARVPRLWHVVRWVASYIANKHSANTQVPT